MREEGGRVVLMDFGSSHCPEQNRTGLERLTGTPAYLAPEVLSGTEPCIASDVYSLGVLLFHLVTGDYPVQGGSADEIRRAHASRSVRRVTDLHGGLPDAFVSAVDGALSPADSRYRNTDDLLAGTSSGPDFVVYRRIDVRFRLRAVRGHGRGRNSKSVAT